MTAGDRLMSLSGLSGVLASAHLRACAGASGSTATDLMVSRSGLSGVSAETHLLAEPAVSSGLLAIILHRRRR